MGTGLEQDIRQLREIAGKYRRLADTGGDLSDRRSHLETALFIEAAISLLSSRLKERAVPPRS